jgi:hypothetical protein
MHAKPRPTVRNLDALSINDVRATTVTWPRQTAFATSDPPRERTGVGVTTPGADLDPFFNTDPEPDDGDDQ